MVNIIVVFMFEDFFKIIRRFRHKFFTLQKLCTEMKATEEYLRMLRDYKEMVGMQYGILRIGLFGSVARGEHKEGSDVDVCVELSSPDLFNLVHIKDDLQKLFGHDVDVVRLRDNMNPFMKQCICEEGIYA